MQSSGSRKKGEEGEEAAACMHACATYTHTNAHFLYLQPTCDASTTAYSYFSPSLSEREADELSQFGYSNKGILVPAALGYLDF